MPVFETIVVLNPTNDQREKGAQEDIIGEYAIRIAPNSDTAQKIALKEAPFGEKDAARVVVLCRPFV